MSDDPTPSSETAGEDSDSPPPARMTWGCQPSLEDLYRYMDGAMDSDRAQLITAHFEHCDGCDDFYHFHTGLRHLVENCCRSELPKDLPDRVFRAITDLR